MQTGQRLLKPVLIIVMAVLTSAVCAQTVEINNIVLSNRAGANVNMPDSAYNRWTTDLKEAVDAVFKGTDKAADLSVIVSFHRNRKTTVGISSRPILDYKLIDSFQAELSRIPDALTYFSEFDVQYIISLNGGDTTGVSFEPKIKTPADMREEFFQELTLPKQAEYMQLRAQVEYLPWLTAVIGTAGDKLQGLSGLYDDLRQTDFRDFDPVKTLDQNPDYWLALNESKPGNQVVPTIRFLAYMAQGKIEHAGRFMKYLRLVTPEGTLSDEILNEYRMFLSSYSQKLSEKVKQGTSMYEERGYADAASYFDYMSDRIPGSAVLLYQFHYARTAVAITESIRPDSLEAEWAMIEQDIYKLDPLFIVQSNIPVGEKFSEDALFRYQVNTMLTEDADEATAAQQFVQTAGHLLFIEEYTMAAHQYHWSLTAINEKYRDKDKLIVPYMYALHKLGVDILQNAYGDRNYEQAFQRIEASLTK